MKVPRGILVLVLATFPLCLCHADVQVESPNGGESIAAGRQWLITWRCDEWIERVTIAFSFTDGVFWEEIASARCSGGRGSYLWTAPDVSSRGCLIRVTAESEWDDSSDQSDSIFTIFPCPLEMDHDGDCVLTFVDLAALAREWLQCGDPYDADCTGNHPPQFVSSIPPRSVPGFSYAYDVRAADPDGDALVYELLRAPQGMTIEPETGTILWTAPADGTGGAVIVQVRDPSGATDLMAFELGTPGPDGGGGSPPTKEPPSEKPTQYAGAPVDGYPNLFERRVLVYTNAVRMAPHEYRDRYMADFSPDSSGILQDVTPVEPLYYDSRLGRAARSHAGDMATNGCFQHDSCDGTAWSVRIWGFYPQAHSIGENIAMGYPTAKAVVDAWLCDEVDGRCAADGTLAAGHRTNIVATNFRQLGAGFEQHASVAWRKYWVQDFASNESSSRPPIVAGCHDYLEGGQTSFLLNYRDGSGAPPQAVQVVVDGTTYDLSLDLGTPAAGTYRLEIAKAGACREYYFQATTAAGERWRYPGPGVFLTDGEGSCAGDYR